MELEFPDQSTRKEKVRTLSMLPPGAEGGLSPLGPPIADSGHPTEMPKDLLQPPIPQLFLPGGPARLSSHGCSH